MNRIVSRLLYAGVEKEEFESFRKDYIEQDRSDLVWYSLIVMIFFGILGIFVSLKDGLFAENAVPYVATAAAMVLILAGAHLLRGAKKKEAGVRLLMYVFMAVLYVEAASVTLRHPDLPAVTFIGILLVLPLLFIDRPVNIMLAQAVFVAAFCVLAAKFKNPDITQTDIWNGITFLIISWVEILVLIPMRAGSMQKTKRIEFLSKSDLLTGVLNRNAYEQRIKEITEKADETLVCVYADANGLHEMNNTLGHEAGDRMLQTVSGELRKAFGYDQTYRIGGDEFVILSRNRNVDTVLQLLAKVRETLQAESYAVSFGMAALREHDMDMQSTIKEAEQRMYEAKNRFYVESGRDRRSRNRKPE